MSVKTLFAIASIIVTTNSLCSAQSLLSQPNKGNNYYQDQEDGLYSGKSYITLDRKRSFASQLTRENTIYEICSNYNLREKVQNLPINVPISIGGEKYYRNKDAIRLFAKRTMWVPDGCSIMTSDMELVDMEGGVYTPNNAIMVYIVSPVMKTINIELLGLITIPDKSVLKFNGGFINNGILYGRGTVIEAADNQIFGDNVTFVGEWGNEESHTIWFGDTKPESFEDQFVDRSSFINNAQQILSNKGGTVKTINGNLYDLNNTITLNKNVSVVAYRRGYKILISNGDESGAVNEFVHKAFYHPAIVIDCDNRIKSEVQLAPSQHLSGHASLLFRLNGASKYNLTCGNSFVDSPHSFSLENLIQNKSSITVFPSNNIAYGSPGLTNYVNTDPGFEHFFYGRLVRRSRANKTPQIEIRQALDAEGKAVSFRSDVNPDGSVTAELGGRIVVSLSDQMVDVRTPIKCAAYTTEQMKAITSPQVGMMVFNTSVGKPAWYNGTSWVDAEGKRF